MVDDDGIVTRLARIETRLKNIETRLEEQTDSKLQYAGFFGTIGFGVFAFILALAQLGEDVPLINACGLFILSFSFIAISCFIFIWSLVSQRRKGD